MDFNDKLRQATEKTGSIACMGLDPVLENVPAKYPQFKFRVEAFM
ncbi:orotidine-5'-phosphate decarboxylase, partial [Candidatus Woesearchaeota archaeon]|nr:orotidine-5'-phosphate decarboxylase [Candidatus Woesearchaeota archaeon]